MTIRDKKTRKLFLLGFFIVSVYSSYAQKTTIRGTIQDAKTKEPLEAANAWLDGSRFGTTTDNKGTFFIEADTNHTTLMVSLIGYEQKTITILANRYNSLKIFLNPENNTLGEVQIQPNSEEAIRLVNLAIQRRKKNKIDTLDRYKYDLYTKIELSLNNVDSLFNTPGLRSLKFVSKHIEISPETGKSYLPVFLTETHSSIYKDHSPTVNKEVIHANKNIGIGNESILPFLGNYANKIHFSTNYIHLMNIALANPISPIGKLYYRFYLTDSVEIDGEKCYRLVFRPRAKMSHALIGKIWITDSTYYLKKIDAYLDKETNINFLEQFKLQINYSRTSENIIVKDNQYLIAELDLTDSTFGILMRQQSSQRNFTTDFTTPKTVRRAAGDVVITPGSMERPLSYWDTLRPIGLTAREKNIYSLMDTVMSLPVIKTFEKIGHAFGGGYWPFKYIEIGPYYDIWTQNRYDGHRFKLGFNTTKHVFPNYRFSLQAGIGVNSKQFIGKIGYDHIFSQIPRRALHIQGGRDAFELGLLDHNPRSFLSSVLRRKLSPFVVSIAEAKIVYFHEWFLGLSSQFELRHQRFLKNPFLPLIDNKTGQPWAENLSTNTFRIRTEFAHKTRFLYSAFKRTYLGSRYPILTFDVQGDFLSIPHLKATFSVRQSTNFGLWGITRYRLELSKLFGTVPYPLLIIPLGNLSYGYSKWAFNLLNYNEFANDIYGMLMIEQHFDGILLNRIPLIRRLKLREVASFKGFMGGLSDANLNHRIKIPKEISPMTYPYFELGVGVENIIKFFRLDVIWRMAHLDKLNAQPLALLVSFEFRL